MCAEMGAEDTRRTARRSHPLGLTRSSLLSGEPAGPPGAGLPTRRPQKGRTVGQRTGVKLNVCSRTCGLERPASPRPPVCAFREPGRGARLPPRFRPGQPVAAGRVRGRGQTRRSWRPDQKGRF